MIQDIRFALRTLLKNPGFTAIAILTLALGIGANTAMFSVVKAVLLAKLAYPNPDQLVQLWETSKKNVHMSVSGPNFHDWHDQNRSMQALASSSGDVVNLSGGFAPQRVRVNPVSREFFDLAGVAPLRGRVFGGSKQQPEVSAVAVIAYGVWQSAFQGSPQAIGKPVSLNGSAFTVIGVMPPGFDFLQRTQIWLPLEFFPDTSTRSAQNYRVFGRLKPGVSRDRAQADLDVVATRLANQYADDKDRGIRVVSLHEQLVGPVKPALLILLSAVAFVLLIACVNIANLQMSRSSSRVKELARSALGAARTRLIRQLLTESVLLSVGGGLTGLVLAYWGTDILRASIPANIPRVATIHVDRWVLLFTRLISVAAGLLFGVLPALAASHTDVNEALREGSGHTTQSLRRRKLGASLVVGEIAVAMVLLVGAALLIGSFWKLEHVDPGFHPSGVSTTEISWPVAERGKVDTTRLLANTKHLLERVRAIPGVEAVGTTNSLPITDHGADGAFAIEGKAPAGGSTRISVLVVSRRHARLLRGAGDSHYERESFQSFAR